MKKILIIHQNMELGGAETSLLGLLNAFDYSTVQVDLFLYEHKGELLQMIPSEVRIMPEEKQYKALVSSIKDAVKEKAFLIAGTRILSKIAWKAKNGDARYSDPGYVLKQVYHRNALHFLPRIKGEYDLAISFNDPHYILSEKVTAKVKLGWFHTDFSKITADEKMERDMWLGCSYAVCVSDSCREAFVQAHPYMKEKTLVIENVLSDKLIWERAKADVSVEMPDDGSIKLLSVGRFCEAKNFDNIPQICSMIRKQGQAVKWYLIGYGNDEELIRKMIAEEHMEDYVVILGKKENPYPYIKACDFYIQPSRYEGKCVAVREAQILHKPVVITNYATASSQLDDGYDGIVVPTENKQCAIAVSDFIQDRVRVESVKEETARRDYTNKESINVIDQLLGVGNG